VCVSRFYLFSVRPSRALGHCSPRQFVCVSSSYGRKKNTLRRRRRNHRCDFYYRLSAAAEDATANPYPGGPRVQYVRVSCLLPWSRYFTPRRSDGIVCETPPHAPPVHNWYTQTRRPFPPGVPHPAGVFRLFGFFRNASRNHSAFRRNFQTRFQTDHTEAVRYYRLPLARCACSLSRLPRNRRLAKTTSHVRFVIVSRNVRTCTGRPGTNFSVRIAPGASSSSSLSPGRYVRGIRRFSDFCAHRYAARNMCGRIAEGAVVLFISKRQRRNGETLTYVNRQNDMKIKRMRRPRIHEGTTYSRTRLTRRK